MFSTRIPRTNPLPILIIFALIFSITASLIPGASAIASPTRVTIISPTADNTFTMAVVRQGGSFNVNYSVSATDNTTPYTTNVEAYGVSGLIGTPVSNLTRTDNRTYTDSFTLYSVVPEGTYNLRVYADSSTWQDTKLLSIRVDNTAPSPVNLIAPTSNTCLAAGGNLTITWSAQDASNTSDNVTIYAGLSQNSGTDNYTTSILSGASYGQGPNTFIFTGTGGINSSQCKVRLYAVDRAGNWSAPQYSSLFSIINVPPTVTGVTPDGGGIWNSGESQHITATLSGTGTTVSYLIELLVNGSNTENITPSWQSVALSGGNYLLDYTWTVSGSTNDTRCKVKVLAKDCAGLTGSAQSTTNFTIRSTAAPGCTFYTPLAGSTKYAGKSDNTTFRLADNIGGPITCEFWFTSAYTENCTTCWTGASGQYLGTQPLPIGDNYFTWTVPAFNSDTCKIKIICTDSAGNTAPFLSPTFKVRSDTVPPVIAICAPSGGSFQVGSTQSITWTASDQPDATARLQYDIYLSTNNGADSFPILIASLSNQQQCASCTCSYSWAVSDNVSSTCKIKIRATDPAGNWYDSPPSGSFAITAATNPVQTGSVALSAGWNLMSLPLIPTNTSIPNILSGIMPSVISVQYYNGTGFIDYTPGAEGNSLSTMEDGKAYWIKMSAGGPYMLTFQGRKTNPGISWPSPSYTFSPGWQMVGFKSSVKQTVSGYLKGTCGTNYSSTVSGYDPTSSPNPWLDLGCTDNLTSGKGYWIKFLGTTAYTFDAGSQ